MTLPQLTVDFQGRFLVKYSSHLNFVCLTIRKCPYWDFATSISWENLPKDKFAIFYETDTCRTGGKYFYISDVAEVNGTHAFKIPRAIRSYMVGTNNDFAHRPSTIISTCEVEHASVGEVVSTLRETTSNSTYEIEWSSDASSEAGGLSSNWSDVLPPQ